MTTPPANPSKTPPEECPAKEMQREFGLDWHADLRIGLHNLEKEWLEQPRLMMRYCELCAESIHNYDDAKQVHDIVVAQCAHDARIDPDSFDIGKITESSIKEVVSLDKECQQAERKANLAKHRTALMQSATRCLEQRRSALENLVKLHGQNYFSEPSLQGVDQSTLKEARHRETHDRIKSRRTKGRGIGDA